VTSLFVHHTQYITGHKLRQAAITFCPALHQQDQPHSPTHRSTQEIWKEVWGPWRHYV